MMSPVFRKVLLDLYGLEFSLEFWWDEKMIDEFHTIVKKSPTSTIRVRNTPDSIVEFKLERFKGVEITPVSEVLIKGNSKHFSNHYKYYKDLRIPIPTSLFNNEFEFPITTICLLNKENNLSVQLDISNFMNLDYLNFRGLTLEEALLDSQDFEAICNEPPNILFAEYLTNQYS